MKRIHISENGINIVFEITDERRVKLLHFSALPFDEKNICSRSASTGFSLFELQLSGICRDGEYFGDKHIFTAPASRMTLADFADKNNSLGRKLEITTHDAQTGFTVISHMQFYTGTSVVRTWAEIINEGEQEQTIEYVSSFALLGIEKEGIFAPENKLKIGVCHNSWSRELQWQFSNPNELGLTEVQKRGHQRSSKTFTVSNIGNWSSKEYAPVGYLENAERATSLAWQIEHNGSWHWSIGDHEGHYYLQLCGPDELHSHWSKRLAAGDRFVTVSCAVCAVNGGFDEAMAQLTLYRRLIRRRNNDNKNLPVIFNDFMNCLYGDPTSEREYPLIDTAAEVGCEYYCIDAGWFSDENWWDNGGEWVESRKRFPEGLKTLTDHIRKKGMIPGLWLEIEVIGKNSPLADKLPEHCFFKRHGKRVVDRDRYHLDFRVPEVRSHCDTVVDRLVHDYGIGYIKMDYNCEPGIGTELNADSFGDGLLAHQRAYLEWLSGVFKRHKNLVIENCSSGGMRMDYAMLSLHSIQSTSDQEDYRNYATIAANAPSVLCPEQAGVWSYPMASGDSEQTVFNMVNAMLLRIHLSGQLASLGEEQRALVKEGIAVYKRIRKDISSAVPFWGLSTSSFIDNRITLGLKCGGRTYLAVWRRQGEDTCIIPLKHYAGRDVEVKCIYPAFNECEFSYNKNSSTLSVRFDRPYTARLFELNALEDR